MPAGTRLAVHRDVWLDARYSTPSLNIQLLAMLEALSIRKAVHAIMTVRALAASVPCARATGGVVVNATDMRVPVTRGELREDLAEFRQDIAQQLSAFEEKHGKVLEKHTESLAHQGRLLAHQGGLLAHQGELLARQRQLIEKTSQDIETWGGSLLARIEKSEQQGAESTRAAVQASEQRLVEQIAHYMGVIREDMQQRFSALHKAFTDRPGRVSRSEAAVSPRATR
jgi:hypothetical protein